MLPFPEFYKQIMQWMTERKFELVRKSAAKRLEALGYVELPIGSYWRWMHKDWFERAQKEKVLVKNQYDMWVPSVKVTFRDKVVGRRGTEPIIEKKRDVDMTEFLQFVNKYETYLSEKYIASMKFSLNYDQLKEMVF